MSESAERAGPIRVKSVAALSRLVTEDPPSLEDLAQRLREFLHARDLGQREAARLLGVPQTRLSRLLSGHDILYSTGIELVARLNAQRALAKPLPADPTVTDIMTRKVRGIEPDWTLRRAQKFLADHDYSHAPLVEGPRRYGELISRRMISDALGAGTPPETLISRCKPRVTDGRPGEVLGSDSVAIVREQLRWHPLLLVKSSANQVKGVVTQANLSLLPPDASVNHSPRPSNRSGWR